MLDANTRHMQRSRECGSRCPATSSRILTLLQSMVRHLPMCVRTSIPPPFFLVGNTCCYMAMLWKLQISRMATSSIFLVSVKEGAMLQVVKQVFSEWEVLTLCHCPDHTKNEFELINVEKVMQCYFSRALNTQELGFDAKYTVRCTTFDSTETEQVGFSLVCRRRWVKIPSEALTILTEFFYFVFCLSPSNYVTSPSFHLASKSLSIIRLPFDVTQSAQNAV